MPMQERIFEPGETIIREGDFGETAYIVEAGTARITKRVGGQEVEIAVVGPGETIGEMSMIDDSPRSATAVALETLHTQEIHQDELYEALQSNHEVTMLLLKVLFERLRESTATIARLQAGGDAAGEAERAPARAPVVILTAQTDEAEGALPGDELRIERFPFRIGRVSHNPLVHNDLSIEDEMPWQVSRHHLAIVNEGGRIGVIDRGSRLGSRVDGREVGGPKADPGPVFFESNEGTLVIGNKKSPFAFRVQILPS